jgi:hypothetical protein
MVRARSPGRRFGPLCVEAVPHQAEAAPSAFGLVRGVPGQTKGDPPSVLKWIVAFD